FRVVTLERCYTGLRPAFRSSGGHLRISAARKAANSSEVVIFGSNPILASRPFTSGDFKAPFISALSLLTTSGGIPAGPRHPSQASGLNPTCGKRLSIIVGMLGRR